MLKNRMAGLALAVGSLISLAAPTAAMARDWRHDDWREARQERRISERERQRLLEQQQRIARERYMREQQALRYRQSTPYGYSARDGYYDRFGQWHAYSYPGYRY